MTTLDGGVVIRSSGGAQSAAGVNVDLDDRILDDGALDDVALDDVALDDGELVDGDEEEVVAPEPADINVPAQDDSSPAPSTTPEPDTDSDTRPLDTSGIDTRAAEMNISALELRTSADARDDLLIAVPTAAADTEQADRSGVAELTTAAPTRAVVTSPPAPTPIAAGTFLEVATDLIRTALAPILSPLPGAPAESPLLWALLAWTRRQFTQPFIQQEPLPQLAQTAQVVAADVAASGLPEDIERITVVDNLNQPTDFAFLPNPDGNDPQSSPILITELGGAIKLYRDGELQPAPVIVLPTMQHGESGLLGIEVDPEFTTNGWIYVSWTSPTDRARLSRFTVDDVDGTMSVDLASELVLLESNITATNLHNGGEVEFGPDGKLYWSLGDNGSAPNSQNLSNLHGKIVRINPDGTVPADNPFVNQAGARDEIYAYGFRNPFRFTFTSEESGAKLLATDVGSASWEELNIVTPGANYGWPTVEGPCTGCEFVNPIYAYPHPGAAPSPGSITGVLHYTGDAFGDSYRNKVFISDYTLGWMKELTFDSEFTSFIGEQMFDETAGTNVKLVQGPDDHIYQLNIFPGTLSVIAPTGGNRTPTAVISVADGDTNGYRDPQTGEFTVTLSAASSSDPDEGDILTYHWDFGGDETSSAATVTKVYVQDGAYDVILTVTDSGGKSSTATQRIVVGSTAPDVTIVTPAVGTKYDAGDTISFSAIASDADQETLPDSAYVWRVDFHHGDHFHPFMDNIVGPSGSFTAPRGPENVDTTWYRMTLTVTDETGLTTTTYQDVNPNLIELTFDTNHPDAVYTIDGTPHRGPYTETAVVGVERVIAAVSPQTVDGQQLVFGNWSNGNLPRHTIVTPGVDTTYTIYYDTYVAPTNPDPVPLLTAIYRSQEANFDRIVGALTGAPQLVLTTAASALMDAAVSLAGNQAELPEVAAIVVNDVVNALALAPALILDAVTDVVATEVVRAVAVGAAVISNLAPITVSLLNAPAEIGRILVDTMVVIIERATINDGLGALGAAQFGWSQISAALDTQQVEVLGAVADLLNDVTAAFALPLPPPASGAGEAASGDLLAPLTHSLERTAKMVQQVGASVGSIAGATVGGQQGVVESAIEGAQSVLLNARGEEALDWVVLALGTIDRAATAGRLAVQEAIARSGDGLAGAATLT